MEPAPLPDYELAATLPVAVEDVHRALGDPRRRRIVALLLERAATAKQLAAAIERSPQTTTHHLDVLHDAGLVRVVRTRRVRAVEERWWGRTARVFLLDDGGERSGATAMLDEARGELQAALDAGVDEHPDATARSTIRYGRVPADRVEELFEELCAVVDRFAASPRAGEVVHGVVVSAFPTAWRPLRTATDDQDGA